MEEITTDGRSLNSRQMKILGRQRIHHSRCIAIESIHGVKEAKSFHLKHKGDPGSDEAKKEFELLMTPKN